MAHHTTVETESKTHHVTLEATEDQLVVAECSDLPGVVMLGATNQEALAKLKAALCAAADGSEG